MAAVLALFAGLASAQVPGGGGTGSLACSASVAVPPQLRTEGFTELIGDIVLTCTGGASVTSGTTIPTANITVSLATNVTSRILTTASLNGGPTLNVTDALLLIDEPGSGLVPIVAGTGPGAPQTPCLTSGGAFSVGGAGPGGCPQVATTDPATGIPVMIGGTVAAPTAAANMYLGVTSQISGAGNQVTFNGIPILPPVSSGTARVFRITNIRANVNGLGGGLLGGTTALNAFISISGSTSLPINNPAVIAGYIQSGLSTAVTSVKSTFLQCQSASSVGTALLSFSENFGTAFKTRVAAPPNANGQVGAPSALQNIPGTIYNSESGFVIPQGAFNITTGGITTGAFQIGLADYGTRLKAVFSGVPSGVQIFVSLTNLSAVTAANTTAPPAGSTTSYAFLVNGEATQDPNGSVPALGPSGSVNGGATAVAAVPLSGGAGTAVWEVINTNPAALETFNFGVYTTYTANQNQNSPPVGTANVNMSFAPTPTAAFSVAAGTSASSSLTLPRFADTSTAQKLLTIQLCQTLLLFPYVTNQAGFDTGIAIANTSTDPIGTSPQAGICTLNWYGVDTTGATGKFPPTGINGTDLTKEKPVATGTDAANLTSVLAPGFQGYMFAVCNFQLAHGFAFISDLGARNLAMGYLALVVNDGVTITRGNAPPAEALNQ